MSLDDKVTILIPTSPIPRHPATDLIEECVGSLRSYLPSAKLVIMADGVRPSVENRRGQYQDYLANLSKKMPEFGNAELKIFSDFSQQVTMTRNVLHHQVHTPLVFFVEHDAIMRSEPRIQFESIFEVLLKAEANIVRFYNWDDIWHEHEPLMRGELQYKGESLRFVKTVQFSGWPLVARTEYLTRILDEIAPAEQNRKGTGRYTMIEPVVYYQIAAQSWDDNKLVIYLDGTRTFTHVDGRVDPVTGRKDPGEW